MPELTLAAFDARHAEFVRRTFPEILDYRKPLLHLRGEVDEAMDGGDRHEFSDMLMLVLSAFRLRYPDLTTDDLLRDAYEKLAINEGRRWRMNADGFAQHVEASPDDAPVDE